MKKTNNDIIMQNKVFVRIALVTGFLLLIPLVLTIRDGRIEGVGWNWTLGDFIVMGTLMFGTGSLFVLAARNVRGRLQRIILGMAFAAAFLIIWAELAVDAVSEFISGFS